MTTIPRLVLPFAAMLVAIAAPVSSAATGRTITVHGTGIVKTTPTNADFTFGVAANGSTATAALSANAAKMNKVIDALKQRGVAAADLQTAQISLQPNRNQNGDKILNYTVTNSVTTRVRSIDKAGPVVDAAVQAGANEITGPSLTVPDELLISRSALKAAFADARGRALGIAAAAGVTLGAVRSITEETTSSPLPFAAAADKVSSTPVAAGTIAIQADVTVVFAIA
jgi:uncharacterized protein YggE